MRPVSFRSDELRSVLLRNQVATLDQLKQALGTPVDVTVFSKLQPLDYLTSYSHRGRYYTLREIARFDQHGLWSLATSGSLSSVRCWPPPKPSSIARRGDTSPLNWHGPCTSKCRTHSIN